VKFAFVIFKYFPFGGAQRDMMRIAQESVKRGHSVHILTLSWEGPAPEHGVAMEVLQGRGWMNHQRYRDFIAQVREKISGGAFDLVVGFNRLPGLDAYFAADPCFLERSHQRRNPLHRLSGRHRFFAACERAVFAPESGCEILLLSPAEKAAFQRWHHTPEARFHLIPPVLLPERLQLGDRAQIRASVREEFGFAEHDRILLLVGSGFKTKGLDRAMQGLSSLPESLRHKTRLVAVGQDNPGDFERMARKMRLAPQVRICGGRSDIPRLMQGSDLLVHPAYRENTGLVLLEAMACGLPVLASDVCGYAPHVLDSGAGLLVKSPFMQGEFNRLLQEMLDADATGWRGRGLDYAKILMAQNDGSAEVRLLEVFAKERGAR